MSEDKTNKPQSTTSLNKNPFDSLWEYKPREHLKIGIVRAVNTTNTILSELEKTNDTVQATFVSRARPLMTRLRYNFQRTFQYFDQRAYYGVPIVIGSSLMAGLLVGVRRGRVPGVITGLITGGGAYCGVYGPPQYKF